jgi:hypothetical protein
LEDVGGIVEKVTLADRMSRISLLLVLFVVLEADAAGELTTLALVLDASFLNPRGEDGLSGVRKGELAAICLSAPREGVWGGLAVAFVGDPCFILSVRGRVGVG